MQSLAIVGDNLNRLFDEEKRLSALALYELSELARVAADRIKEVADPDERERILSEILFRFVEKNDAPDAEAPCAYIPFADVAQRDRFSVCAAAFAVFLSEAVTDGVPMLPWQESRIAAPRLCYVKQARTDGLYLALSERVPRLAVSYAERNEDAVRAVSSGRADYALLPYALGGERLAATLSLVAKHELYLSGTVDVKEGDGVLTYALFSKACAPFLQQQNMHLALRLTADTFSTLGTVFSAFSAFGFRQTDFLPEQEEYGRACGRVTLVGDGNLPALWLYLSFLSVGAAFLGRYPHFVIEN